MFATVVYIPPSTNTTTACGGIIHSVTTRLQTRRPDAFILISGDLNHISLKRALSTFTQFVECPTRENQTLDLWCVNIKLAFSWTGRSEINLVYLLSTHLPLARRQPATQGSEGVVKGTQCSPAGASGHYWPRGSLWAAWWGHRSLPPQCCGQSEKYFQP